MTSTLLTKILDECLEGLLGGRLGCRFEWNWVTGGKQGRKCKL